MNKMQIAKQNRNKSLVLVIDANQLVWITTPAFVTINAEFNTDINDIDSANERQKSAITGIAVDKLNKKIAMVKEALRVAGAVKAYAESINDQTLFNKINFSESRLMGTSSINSRNRCQIIHDQADKVLANLATYGITTLAPLKDAIDTFNDFIGAPKKGKALVKTATKDLKTLTKATDTLLSKKMTPLMELYRVSAPQFYDDYQNALSIDNPKTNFTELRIIFKDKNTNQLLEGVKTTAKGEEHTYELISNASGVADEKQISPELYDITYELPGYEKGELDNKQVKLGKKVVILVEMKPNA